MKKSHLRAVPANAAAHPSKPEPIHLRLGELEGLANAISALDRGTPRVITVPARPPGATPSEQVTNVPFELAGSVRFALFRNLSALASSLDAFARTKAAVAREIWGPRPPDVVPSDTPEADAWHAKIDPLLAEPIEVRLIAIKTDDLRLDVNPIPLGVLTCLSPILSD
jgi:hypothetical protein